MAEIRVERNDLLQYAQLYGIDLSRVVGTGKDGAISEADIDAARQAGLEGSAISIAASAARAEAAQLGVKISASAAQYVADCGGAEGLASQLSAAKPTGSAGEVTLGDIRASLGLRRDPPPADEEGRAAYWGMSLSNYREMIGNINANAAAPMTSRFAAARTAGFVAAGGIDPDLNPLVAAAAAQHPQRVAAARGVGSSVPTLFNSGDLPPFTASGIDPQVLRQVPWQARHSLARAETTKDAYQVLSDYSGSDAIAAAEMEVASDPANVDYSKRVEQWLVDGMTDDQIYDRSGFAARDAAALQARSAGNYGSGA